VIAERKHAMKQFGSNLPLKVIRWTEDNAIQILNLLLSTFYRFDRSRFENYVAFIEIDEIDKGFRVVSATEVPVTSLPDDVMQLGRERFSDFTKISSDAHYAISCFLV
jgi:hypothetical protein